MEITDVVDTAHFVGRWPRSIPTRAHRRWWTASSTEGFPVERAAYDATGTRFTVGDFGRLDTDGYLYLTDRDGDLIISGGVNIYPREAENVLHDHPAVADAAVVGVDDPDLGQRAVAVVVPAAGVEGDTALAEALLAHCREHLARFKCPREFRFQAELPRSEAGKIVKREIRRALEEAEM